MEFLEFPESLDDIIVLSELLSGLAELLLGLKVLLEVEVAEIPVYLDHVVELLDIELVRVVKVTELGRGNRSDLPPAVLQLAESGEGGTDILLFLDKGLEILDHGLLSHEVVFPLGILLTIVLGALLLVVGINAFERGLNRLERIVLYLVCRGSRSDFLNHILPGRRLIDLGTKPGLRLLLGESLIES